MRKRIRRARPAHLLTEIDGKIFYNDDEFLMETV
jgi:hypothetical protein